MPCDMHLMCTAILLNTSKHWCCYWILQRGNGPLKYTMLYLKESLQSTEAVYSELWSCNNSIFISCTLFLYIYILLHCDNLCISSSVGLKSKIVEWHWSYYYLRLKLNKWQMLLYLHKLFVCAMKIYSLISYWSYSSIVLWMNFKRFNCLFLWLPVMTVAPAVFFLLVL